MDDANELLDPNSMTFAFLVLPPVIAVINQRTWSREVRGTVALAVCLLYSVLVTALRSDVDWAEWRNVILQVMIGTFGAYKLFWEPSNISHRIEEATDFTHPPEARPVPPDPAPPATPPGTTPDNAPGARHRQDVDDGPWP